MSDEVHGADADEPNFTDGTTASVPCQRCGHDLAGHSYNGCNKCGCPHDSLSDLPGPDVDASDADADEGGEPTAWMVEEKYPKHGWVDGHIYQSRERAEDMEQFTRSRAPGNVQDTCIVPLYRHPTDPPDEGEWGLRELAHKISSKLAFVFGRTGRVMDKNEIEGPPLEDANRKAREAYDLALKLKGRLTDPPDEGIAVRCDDCGWYGSSRDVGGGQWSNRCPECGNTSILPVHADDQPGEDDKYQSATNRDRNSSSPGEDGVGDAPTKPNGNPYSDEQLVECVANPDWPTDLRHRAKQELLRRLTDRPGPDEEDDGELEEKLIVESLRYLKGYCESRQYYGVAGGLYDVLQRFTDRPAPDGRELEKAYIAGVTQGWCDASARYEDPTNDSPEMPDGYVMQTWARRYIHNLRDPDEEES